MGIACTEPALDPSAKSQSCTESRKIPRQELWPTPLHLASAACQWFGEMVEESRSLGSCSSNPKAGGSCFASLSSFRNGPGGPWQGTAAADWPLHR